MMGMGMMMSMNDPSAPTDIPSTISPSLFPSQSTTDAPTAPKMMMMMMMHMRMKRSKMDMDLTIRSSPVEVKVTPPVTANRPIQHHSQNMDIRWKKLLHEMDLE